MQRCPGGERKNVWAFDRLFRDEGAMQVGKVGRAVCRLLHAEGAAQIMRRELARDPAFVLGKSPHSAESQFFLGKIKQARLAQEDFHLSAWLPWDQSANARCLEMIRAQGIGAIELQLGYRPPTPVELAAFAQVVQAAELAVVSLAVSMAEVSQWQTIVEAARAVGARQISLLPPARTGDRKVDLDGLLDNIRAAVDCLTAADLGVLLATTEQTPPASLDVLGEILAGTGPDQLAVAFDPVGIVKAGQKPFYDGLYSRPRVRLRLGQVRLADIATETGQSVPLGWGNTELTEIISNLRCRSFVGYFCLHPAGGRPWQEGFYLSAEAFWKVLDSI